jgi:hypothetical protein
MLLDPYSNTPPGALVVQTFLCRGAADPFPACSARSAGYDAVKGVTMQILWRDVQPSPGALATSAIGGLASQWRDAGKEVNLVFETAPYFAGDGGTPLVPAWYETPVTLQSAAQTGGVLTLTSAGGFDFFVGAPAGQQVQVSGTGTALDGIYAVTSVSGTTLQATGLAGNDGLSAHAGGAGNPMVACNGFNLPAWWGPNFDNAWQDVMTRVKTQLDDGSLGYVRFGMGLGGENSPVFGEPSTCEATLTSAGYTSTAPPWPAAGTAAWMSQVVDPVWMPFEQRLTTDVSEVSFLAQPSFSLSPTEYGTGSVPIDYQTPDQAAAIAVDAGFAIGNQAWREGDSATYAANGHCGGDWCALFDLYRGQVALELQTVAGTDPGPFDGGTGSLARMLPFALQRGAQILEIYNEDWLCSFDATYLGFPPYHSYAECVDGGYPEALTAAAGQLN